MASRFVTFAVDGEESYAVSGVGFKYLDLSEEDAAKIMSEAALYRVEKIETERYSHDEYGDYESTSDVRLYNIDEVKSLSEKIWLRYEGACDIIVQDGRFVGVVFFTGFTDYRGEKRFGFVPIESVGSDKLTKYTYVHLSVLLLDNIALPQSERKAAAAYSQSGRSTTSYSTNYYLVKKNA